MRIGQESDWRWKIVADHAFSNFILMKKAQILSFFSKVMTRLFTNAFQTDGLFK